MLGSVKVLVGKDDARDYRGARVKRTTVTAMPAGLTRVVLRFGFMEKPDVAGALRMACQASPELQDMDPAGVGSARLYAFHAA